MAPEATEQQTIEEITPQEAFAELDGGGVKLIDTREPYEYEESHIEGGELIPPGVIADRIEAAVPDKDQRIILQCRSGARSLVAAEALAGLGYTNLAN
ncbi:MAG TPA: rhodanese-like domain-containing protein, partial [Solirubrobacterales bacterium]|nr:rhodanese-like domain-containing protein [Solirubrobacterales bacterium]